MAFLSFAYVRGRWWRRESTIDTCIINVIVSVCVPANKLCTGREEHITPIQGGVYQIRFVFAFAAGDQEVTAIGHRIKSGIFTRATAVPHSLELVDVHLVVLICGGERIQALEKQALPVIGQ